MNGVLKEASDIRIYTDGSHAGGQCAWAFVVVTNGALYCRHARRMTDMPAGLAKQQNVAAEMKASMAAAAWAKTRSVRPTICYDYEGVEKWVTGEWTPRNQYTRSYRDYMRDAPIEGFRHVSAHSGEKWNEMADTLSRSAALDGSREACSQI
jgi:ribonuclease HI